MGQGWNYMSYSATWARYAGLLCLLACLCWQSQANGHIIPGVSNFNPSHRARCGMCSHNYAHRYGGLPMDHGRSRVRAVELSEQPAPVLKVETNHGEYCTQAEVRRICSVIHPTENDVVYELGCADGRFCAELSRYGCTVVGIELIADRVALANERMSKLPKHRRERIRIVQGDIRSSGLIESQATIVIVHQMHDLLADIAYRLYKAKQNKLKCVCSIAHPLTMHKDGKIVDYWWAPIRVPHDDRRFFIYRR